MIETCPNGCDLRGEPIPEENLHLYNGVTHYSKVLGYVMPGIYDGVLYWACPVCGLRWPRFPEGDWRRQVALDLLERS